MNIQDAVTVYLSDVSYENICNDTFNLKLIADRNTKRTYLLNGHPFDATVEQILSEDWYVIKNN